MSSHKCLGLTIGVWAWSSSEQGLTGTKLGCGEGGCGACTVMVSSWENGVISHHSVNACLAPLYSVEGMQVVTVEGMHFVAQY